jgi:hypothetical protein
MEERSGRVQRHKGSDSTYNAAVGQRICVLDDQSHHRAREIGRDTQRWPMKMGFLVRDESRKSDYRILRALQSDD